MSLHGYDDNPNGTQYNDALTNISSTTITCVDSCLSWIKLCS